MESFIADVISSVRERECEVHDEDGRSYSLRVRPYFTLDNKIDGAVLVLIDITDLKRAEREAKAARDYAEAIIRTARDPLVVLHADLRVNTANKAFYTAFKATPDQIEGRRLSELAGGAWNSPKLNGLLEDILTKSSVINEFEVACDFPHIGRRTVLLNARRLDEESGAPQRILLALEDITERKKDEGVLRLSEERFRTLFEAGPMAVYSCDIAGVIQEFNHHAPPRLWGRTPKPGTPDDTDERFCGSFKMYSPDGVFMPHEQCPMAEVVAGRVPATVDQEVAIERPDGSRITVIVNIRPLKGKQGEIIGAINCFYDITQRKLSEEALKKSHDEVQAHHWKNWIGSIASPSGGSCA